METGMDPLTPCTVYQTPGALMAVTQYGVTSVVAASVVPVTLVPQATGCGSAQASLAYACAVA
ncbi:MAG: hypothetical protein IPL81_16630 [Flavobacteriales bacterium]|nr:hypothetical protein [Flavobacteriales bacterium]